MLNRKECLDYASNSYIYVYTNKCALYYQNRRIKEFATFEEAYDYWYNHYVR